MLLKGLSHGGFVFYTNYGSAKAEAMAHNPQVSLLFPWNELDRQVIVGGRVEKMSVAESASYFLTRPRESQIAAWASRQSRPISARALLEKQVRVLREKFGKGEIPMPDFWGVTGYCPAVSSSGRVGSTACTTASSTPCRGMTTGQSSSFSHDKGELNAHYQQG